MPPAEAVDGAGLLSFVRVTRRRRMDRHTDVDHVAAALAFPAGASAWRVAAQAAIEAPGMQEMALADADGDVVVRSAELVDLVGSSTPEVVMTVETHGASPQRLFVVCNAGEGWCTKPEPLVPLPHAREHLDAPRPAPTRHTFRRHARGVLVESREPDARDRLFPFVP